MVFFYMSKPELTRLVGGLALSVGFNDVRMDGVEEERGKTVSDLGKGTVKRHVAHGHDHEDRLATKAGKPYRADLICLAISAHDRCTVRA